MRHERIILDAITYIKPQSNTHAFFKIIFWHKMDALWKNPLKT
jgi:hypothetical protein